VLQPPKQKSGSTTNSWLKGLKAAVEAMVDGAEYARFFGEDVVPYNRFPSLPAGNYLGSVKAATDLVKQSWSDLSPSSLSSRFS
jgi:phycobilisome core-membrane linker protein